MRVDLAIWPLAERTRRVRPPLGALVALLLFLALPTAAPAAPPVTIASQGTGAGQVENPLSTAVEQSSGDLYVADRSNFRIDKFDSEGNFLLAWGFGVADGASAQLQTCGPAAVPPTKRCFGPNLSSNNGAGNVIPQAVAVDQSTGDVYVADATKLRITKFSPSGQFIFLVGKNVNATKVAEAGATQAEKNICTAVSEDTCTSGASGTGPDEFTTPRSLAVTPSGEVWIGDNGRLKSFDSSGVPGAEVVLSGAGNTQSLALDPAGDDFYVKSASIAGIRKLEAGTGALLETLDAAGEPRTVTLDAGGNIYVGDATSPYRFLKFSPAGEQVSQFGAGQVLGSPGNSSLSGANAIAVGEGADALYVASSQSAANSFVQRFPLPEPGPLVESQDVENLLPATATLAAQLDPEGRETTYHFEYGTSESYGESTPTATLESGGVAYEGFEEKPVSAGLEGLTPETTYHFRLVATNHCNPAEPAEQCTVAGPDTTFTTRPAIAIDAQWASDVFANSAALHAELDPLGAAASWWIEYGTDASYGSSTARRLLPAGFGDVAAGAVLTNLAAGTTYHYRFAAEDERDGITYLVHGADRAFTTQLGGLGFQLPDSRAWEMVSPANKFGGKIGFDGGEGQVQAAADGDAVSYLSVGSIEAAPEGNRALESSSELSRRGTDGTWASRDITPPHTTVTGPAVGVGREYKLFNSDLSSALLEPRDITPLSPQASERTPYLRQNGEPPSYTPLVTGREGLADVPPGTEFGGNPEINRGEVGIRGATPDLGHVVLQSGVPLTPGAAFGGLYEWMANRPPTERLRPVSVKPEGGAPVEAAFGGGFNLTESISVRHAISDDGSRLFWSTVSGGHPTGVYLRDMDREETLRLDVVQPGAFGGGEAGPAFQGASSSGDVAFFTDPQQLAADANEKGADLYRCEVIVEGGEMSCNLSDLTAQTTGAGESAELLSPGGKSGVLAGISDDGSRAYFVARGVLDPGTNGEGEGAIAGQPNLYLWQQGTGIRFIATLSEEDTPDWGQAAGGCCYAFNLTAAVSPSGRYLAFMSQRSLTGYDNRDAASGELDQEVFRYDADTGELVCASCNPSGARPVGLHGHEGPGLAPNFDPQSLWAETNLAPASPLAAVLPEATKTSLTGASLYRPRAMQDNGRLFFNAADSLVPADSNGNWDVYEYEPSGTGSCTSSGSAATAVSAGGCVSLISAGAGGGESAFLDASEGGNDVFFLSSARLSALDEDNVADVYDARVNGLAATRAPNAECLGEACQPAPSVPAVQTLASSTFSGPGNPPPQARKRCPRHKHRVTRKGRTRCVARKQGRTRKGQGRHHRQHRRAGVRR